jgi:predicted ATPase/DNA-binding SARP family transcriptional activator
MLGPLTVVGDDGTEIRLTAAKEKALLSVLALRAGQVVPVGGLKMALWGDREPRSATKTLQGYVSSLRRRLPPGTLESSGGGYRLQVSWHDVDALRFEQLSVQGADAVRQGDSARAAGLLKEALMLWRGEPLADLSDQPAGSRQAARLSELRRSCDELLAEARLSLGEHAALLGDLESAVAAEPLRENRWSQLMLGLYRSGRQADALRAYKRLQNELREQLGIAPGADVKSLEEAILLQKPELDWIAPPSGLTGVGRSWDDDRRDVMPARRPTLRHNLPSTASSFIGRADEIERIEQLLVTRRLVTVIGPGGIGKTRLAIQTAAGLIDKFSDGVWMFELAALNRPEGLEPSMLTTLGRSSIAVESARQALLEAVRSWRALLIMDNCEHLLRSVGAVVRELLSAGGDLTVLATSREPLHLPGEQVVTVGPLPVRDDAVTLFMDRAESLRDSFDPSTESCDAVDRICEQLDGVPLAIELAAARTVAMTPLEIERRLDQQLRLLTDRSADVDRHRSLRRVLDWSYDLLEGDTAAFFCRLCVFVGNFDAQAAHAVCGVDDEFATMDMLADLVDKSLLTATPLGHRTSYRLLETMRQYGTVRLDDQEHARLLNAHVAYFADLVERSWEGVRGCHNQVWLDSLDDQFGNVRAALEKAILDGDVDVAVRISGCLFPYAYERRRVEMSHWLELTMALPGAEQHQMAPRVRLHRGFTRSRAGYLASANSELQWVLDGHGAQFDSLRPAALHLMAIVAGSQGSLDGLERLGRESLEECRRLGDDYDYDRAEALFCVCGAAVFRGVPETAPTREYLELGRKLGKGRALTGALLWSGAAEPDLTRSIKLLTEAAAEEQRPWESYWHVTAVAWLGVIQSADDPLAALEAIPALLEYARSTGDYLILVLRSVDFLSPLSALGRYRDVAILNGVTGSTSFTSLRPALAAGGISAARSVLGEESYVQLKAVGTSFSTSELAFFLGRLWTELHEARVGTAGTSTNRATTASP